MIQVFFIYIYHFLLIHNIREDLKLDYSVYRSGFKSHNYIRENKIVHYSVYIIPRIIYGNRLITHFPYISTKKNLLTIYGIL